MPSQVASCEYLWPTGRISDCQLVLFLLGSCRFQEFQPRGLYDHDTSSLQTDTTDGQTSCLSNTAPHYASRGKMLKDSIAYHNGKLRLPGAVGLEKKHQGPSIKVVSKQQPLALQSLCVIPGQPQFTRFSFGNTLQSATKHRTCNIHYDINLSPAT